MKTASFGFGRFIRHSLTENSEQKRLPKNMHRTVPADVRTPIWMELEKLRSDERKDDVITFEQLGVDRLFVDESHFYKNRAKRCA